MKNECSGSKTPAGAAQGGNIWTYRAPCPVCHRLVPVNPSGRLRAHAAPKGKPI